MQEKKKNYGTEERLKELTFLFQNEDFTADQVRQVLAVVFLTKTSHSMRQFTAYGMKHLVEWIADFVRDRPRTLKKYCSSAIVRQALILEGFTNFGDTDNPHYNISAREYLRLYNLLNGPEKVYSLIRPLPAYFINERKNLAK